MEEPGVDDDAETSFEDMVAVLGELEDAAELREAMKAAGEAEALGASVDQTLDDAAAVSSKHLEALDEAAIVSLYSKRHPNLFEDPKIRDGRLRYRNDEGMVKTLGHTEAVGTGRYFRAVCLLHGDGRRGKGKCTAWVTFEYGVDRTETALACWLCRGEEMHLTKEEHIKEGRDMRAVLEKAWRLARASSSSSSAAPATITGAASAGT